MAENKRLYLSSPNMSSQGYEMEYIKLAFDTNWISTLGQNVDGFENEMENYTAYFALTQEQLKDEKCKVLFEKGTTKEFAQVDTIKETKNLNTKHPIQYIKNGVLKMTENT